MAAGTDEDLATLRARAAELEARLTSWPMVTGTMLRAAIDQFERTKTPLGSTLVLEDAIASALKAGRAAAAPDPRDTRIAELEVLIPREQFLTKRVAERGEIIEIQIARIAELEAALREIERLTARTERDSRGDDRTIKFIADTARRALGDAHG